ncbi:MAG: LamG domain-containing protein [Phycisphaerae bacterium]|nr:LamG domain-containing protein [Phycisphaerae bacterium]
MLPMRSSLARVVATCLVSVLGLPAVQPAGAKVQVAGSLLVDLDARHPSAGSSVWVNAGSMGHFDRVGAPTLTTVGTQAAVQFNGKTDAFRSQNPTTATIEGNSDRSIEVWALNPDLEPSQGEETMVAWGRRGETGANMGFSFGSNASWGAVTHYAGDMGWGEAVPAAGQWHHLVYTFDGKTARVYDNTVERNSAEFNLATHAGDCMDICAQNGSDGGILFASEFNGNPMSLSGSIAVVRVHSQALTADQIRDNFNEDKDRFGAAVPPAPVDMLSEGMIDLETPDFDLCLVRSSQTVAALRPKGAGAFDFTPADRLSARKADGFMHLGDLTLRLRQATAGPWTSYSTAAARAPVLPLQAQAPVLAAADLAPTLPSACPVGVKRSWELEAGRLVLKFVLTNRTDSAVQIGAIGIPMVFNNYITGRNLTQAHEICSFPDPYVGLDAGYLRVARLKGCGPTLLVVPQGKTPFEAYNPLLNEPTQRSQTFEGFYEWLVHSQAWAENEWSKTQPWNEPTMRQLDPGDSVTYGLRFLVSDEIRHIDRTLEANRRPVAIGVPGYILPQGLEGRLFLKYPAAVQSVVSEPAGAIQCTQDKDTSGAWQAFTLQGRTWGRARLLVTYADGTRQSIHYTVTKPMAEAVADLGRFLFTRQWYTDANDPFGRAPSVISFDREANRPVLQDDRVWIAGLQDEGGAGSWLAAAMKEFGRPDAGEVAQFEQFVDGVLWGKIQYSEPFFNSDVKRTHPAYSVRRSLFFYQPSAVPGYTYATRSGWDRGDAYNIWRSYNYVHVAAANWALYRLARNNPGLVKNHPWQWYLDHAWRAGYVMATDPQVGYDETGQMEGTVYIEILKDLLREGMNEEAAQFEAAMKARADHWNSLDYPFGSEMAWDSTGQEEVHGWCKYFGYHDKAAVTLSAILGYMPTVPHWGYNGNAWRYWDFQYGGKIRRIERQIHHYGSGMNAIPVLAAYRDQPEDFYLLRVGYGGATGPLSNIDPEGFASCAFHSRPDTMTWDAYSGDYGPGFLGHAMTIATYVVRHPDLGWLAFGGNLREDEGRVSVQTLDSFRRRVYVAPMGLWMTLDSGEFESVEIDLARKAVRIGLAPASAHTPAARLRLEQPAQVEGMGAFGPIQGLAVQRGAFEVPLGPATTWVDLGQTPRGGLPSGGLTSGE